MESEDPAKRAADMIAEVRNGFGKPQPCFCTGACKPDPANCPAVISASLPLDEQLEERATLQEIFGHPEVAALIRAAKQSA